VPTSLGQLYDEDSLHSYEYRYTSVTNGNTYVFPVQVAYFYDTYEGVAAKRVVIESDSPNLGSEVRIHSDMYFTRADNSALGGHWKAVSGGQIILEENMSASQVNEGRADMDVAEIGELYDSAPLAGAGSETVTIDEQAYGCTKYTFVVKGVARTAWYTPQAPIPVKMQWDHDGFSDTYELLKWI
jgi:hypothetical protein